MTPHPHYDRPFPWPKSLFEAAPALAEELQAAVMAYDNIVSAMAFGTPYALAELQSPAFTRTFERARAVIAQAIGGAA